MSDPPPVYAVSDVHGHLDDLVSGLHDAGLTDPTGHWTGGEAQLWVLGDLLDRGPDGAGVVHLLHGLEREAPGQVHVLLGNHEALALGKKLFDSERFDAAWLRNGGRVTDQDRLTDELVAWMLTRPVIGLTGSDLLMHSDTEAYLGWGSTVETINATVAAELARDDEEAAWGVFAQLSGRYDFARTDGPQAARRMCARLGGRRLVHGHSIIATLVDQWPAQTDGPLSYADGRVLAIDGGRYDGGPLLVVQLQ